MRNGDNLFKKLKLLKNKQQKSYKNAGICYVSYEKFEDKNKLKY